MNIISTLTKYQMYVVATAVLIFIGTLYVLVPQDIAYWTQYWWMFPVAFVIALIVNTAGISGAALFVPFFISDVERAKHKSAAFVLPSRGANKGSIPRCLHRDSMSEASSTNTSSACYEDPLFSYFH